MYPSVENFYQSMKIIDESARLNFLGISAAEAKALADANPITTPNWTNVRNDVMRTGLRLKFQHPDLRKMLLDTASEPIYHLSPWDLYWGVNREMVGKNVLGEMIMAIRESIFIAENNLF